MLWVANHDQMLWVANHNQYKEPKCQLEGSPMS
jgi:hypothetical protein